MDIRYADANEISHWNDFIVKNPDGGNLLQGKEFIDQKVSAGWVARFLFAGDRAIAVIEKDIPLLGKVWYCPKGPSTTSADDLKQVVAALKDFGHKEGVSTIKIEPELDYQTDLSSLGLIPTQPIQYNYSTVYIDLTPSLDDILTALPQKGRHAIRRGRA